MEECISFETTKLIFAELFAEISEVFFLEIEFRCIFPFYFYIVHYLYWLDDT